MINQRVAFRYLRKAGILKPPPAMMDQAWTWVQAQVAADILTDAERELSSGYLSEDKKELLKTRTNEMKKFLLPRVRVKEVKEVRQKMPIDLTGWEYSSRIRSAEGAVDRIKEKMPFYTLVFTRRVLAKGSANAYWDGTRHVLTVRYPQRQFGILAYGEYFDQGLKLLLDQIHPSLRHEMQHLAQTVLLLAFAPEKADVEENRLDYGKTPALPGLPSSSIMTPQFMQEMERLSKKNQRKYKQLLQEVQGLLGTGHTNISQLHTLDDVEFYTRLSDEIDKFNKEYGSVADPARRKSVFKAWVGASAPSRSPFGRSSGASETFSVWKSHAKDKWKKAVKEMAKAVL